MNYAASVLAKARSVRLLILDVDGVLTDGRLYYSDAGTELKAFSTQDGAAIKMLADTGVTVAIITGRESPIVARRAAELGIDHVHQRASNKASALAELASNSAVLPANMAHAGDDLPDLALFNRVGMALSVPGAHPVVAARADYVTQAPPGAGAVREICQLLMVAHDTWTAALARYDS
jgi:3-deoxy-D-manno-octulosonate 8-phosphate phosphatase (KDO 8-P phosphatase)